MNKYWLNITRVLDAEVVHDKPYRVEYGRPYPGMGGTRFVSEDMARLLELAKAAGKAEAKEEIRNALDI